MMFKNIRYLFILGAIILFAFLTMGAGYSFAQEPVLKEKINNLKWVAYSPTDCDPEENRWPQEDSIKKDLKVLRSAGFEGLITYATGKEMATIPVLAQEAGFKGLIIGIWNPKDMEEIKRAIQNDNKLVIGFCLGNEGIIFNQYSLEDLKKAMDYVRNATGKAVTTSEPVHMYFKNKSLLEIGDFYLPVVHPWWAGLKEPEPAVSFTVEQYNKLQNLNSQKPVLIKETGLPTGGNPQCSEEKQREFYQLLEKKGVKFAYFEAFDQFWKISRPWVKRSPIETYWGIFTAERKPKLITQDLIAENQNKIKADACFTIGQNNYLLLGKEYSMDVAPFVEKDRTYLPLRYLAYSLGIPEDNVKWDESNKTVSLQKENISVRLTVGSNIFFINGKEESMDVFPIMNKNRVFLPARFVAQAFGYKVSWDGKSVYLSKDAEKPLVEKIQPVPPSLKPSIEFTSVPLYGSFENLKGLIKGVNPADYKIAVYIYVDNSWWTKPYWDNPLTLINKDGSFTCDITTGGIDQYATKIKAYLLPKDYHPPVASGQSSLPSEIENKALAVKEAVRNIVD